ncbi:MULTISPECIES: SOS response-associated peptidase [unclassified Polaromonas]|uniref:SOS response-associated peptidase n=1 Tax=unclassified Polaromonas TaxID=2638319 RepID=UPI0018CA0D9A|nr:MULTISPECIES: SOS response-associated peptidase family protein [unclassified Polaromonas]MBG6072528.1 putative SOS response-associated peptidase YedK [Polaromonas sp. CG_9.7]MBG6114532.1 putative SOS response-associated peptidase YedK [Polaromonas sp. CG_9.2]MDH6185536.1 putative SOS response-associated peptidase YedK [Polaromonas sp. CG_23.6]
MSTHYQSVHSALLYPDAFRVDAPVVPVGREVWPRQPGVFIRVAQSRPTDETEVAEKVEKVEKAEEGAEADMPPREPLARALVAGQFGLVPRWVKSASDAKLRSTKLVNARSETVTTSNNFRDAWLAGQRCIVPMMAFMEDDWRSGKAVPTRISRVDGKPLGVAGLWESWTGADGEVIVSYTLLTVNANSHALMSRYQQPGNEKRMLAILNEGAFDAWLGARPEKAKEFMRAYPANWLTANPVEKSRQ